MQERARPSRRPVAAVVVLFAVGSLRAAEPDIGSIRTWTLDQALAEVDRLPEIEAARAGQRAAAAEARAAGRFLDPSVSVSTHSITARESFGVAVPLPWPGRGPRIEVARARVVEATMERDVSRLDARRALRDAWFGLAAAEDRARAMTERSERIERSASAVDALFTDGRASKLDQSRARGEAALAAADAAQAEEQRAAAESALHFFLSSDAGPFSTERPWPPPPLEPPLSPATERVLAESPRVRSAASRLDAAEASVRLARSARFPGVGVEAGADFDDPTQPGVDKNVGVVLTLPFRAGPGLALAEAERDRAAALLRQVRRETTAALDAAWHSAHASRLRYEAMDAAVLPAAREAAELTGISYREGRSDLFRLLEAERALSDAELARADAYLEWGKAEAELLALTGEESP